MENIKLEIEIGDTNLEIDKEIQQKVITNQNAVTDDIPNSVNDGKIHPKLLNLHCNHCKYFSLNSILIDLHLNTKKNELYRCHNCEFSTECLKKLMIHLKKDHPNYNIKICHICSYTTDIYNYDRHIRLHYNENCFNCNYCGYLGKRKYQLQDHISIKHDQVYKSVCDHCTRKFASAYDLRKHYKRNLKCAIAIKIADHSNLQILRVLPKLHCNHCKYSTRDGNLFSEFRNMKKDELYRCHSCDFSAECLKKLKRHQKYHRNNKVYRYPDNKMCHICSTTINYGNLHQHMKIHCNEKPYKCNHCGYSCVRKMHLKDHVGIQHDQIKFVCEQCSKIFTRAQYLKEHFKIFHEPPIHKCDKCEYASGCKKYLYRHKLKCHKN